MVTDSEVNHYLDKIHADLVEEYENRGYPLKYLPTINSELIYFTKFVYSKFLYRIVIDVGIEELIHSFVCRKTGNIYSTKAQEPHYGRIVGNIRDDSPPTLYPQFRKNRSLTTIRR